jgi:hypothetical protein
VADDRRVDQHVQWLGGKHCQRRDGEGGDTTDVGRGADRDISWRRCGHRAIVSWGCDATSSFAVQITRVARRHEERRVKGEPPDRTARDFQSY